MHGTALVVALALAVLHGQRTEASWDLVWSDEFNIPSIDASKWSVKHNLSHCCPEELQLYMSDDVFVENGHLVLRTRRRKALGPGKKVYNFTSGWVDTKEKFYQAYGRVEVRAALPQRNSTGSWPAIWMLPNPSTSDPPNVCWPVGGEIDLMEYTSNELMDSVFTSLRFGDTCKDNRQVLPGAAYPELFNTSIDFTKFHVYALEWEPSALRFYVDDNLVLTHKSPEYPIPKDPMYLILNTAVAWYWPPTDTAIYPTYHRVDYVRFYKPRV